LRQWYELKFTLEFRTRFGTPFQDFFADIMERGYPSDFQKVKPYGRKGDLKCDGFHQSLRRVYQVYAPEKMNASETISKIEEDFSGAVENWKPDLQNWIFMHNQWRGIPGEVLQKLLAINGTEGVAVVHWCETELKHEFLKLSAEEHSFLLGPAPTMQSISQVQMKDVIAVVNVIAQQDAPPPEEVQQVPRGKLAANALSASVESLLTTGSRKARLVKDFFSRWHDPELGDRIAKSFRSRYETLRDGGTLSNEAFFELWKFAGGGSQTSVEHEAAVLAVLAFLFEECDIFEAPPA
jgi:hypothetical protein